MYIVKEIEYDNYLDYIDNKSISYLQIPEWANVKTEWKHQLLGWFNEKNEIKCVAVVLLRSIPKTNKSLAYIPEGPIFEKSDLEKILIPLSEFLKKKAFGLIVGPRIIMNIWNKDTIKEGISNDSIKNVTQLKPSSLHNKNISKILVGQKFKKESSKKGFSMGQPEFVFRIVLENKSLDDIYAGFNQLWRRNIKKATKLGVQVLVDNNKIDDFYKLYVETAKRDKFIPRGKEYFEKMILELSKNSKCKVKIFTAYFNNEPIASTILVRVNKCSWYAYGASSSKNEHRNARGSNMVQWEMIKDAYYSECNVYDLRGIVPTLDKNDPLFGLINFKLATGGEVVQYIGEWTKVLDKKWYTIYKCMLKLRELLLKIKRR